MNDVMNNVAVDHFWSGSEFDKKIEDFIRKKFPDAVITPTIRKETNPYHSHVKFIELKLGVKLILTETCDGSDNNPRRMIVDIYKGEKFACGAGYIDTKYKDYEDAVLSQINDMIVSYDSIEKYI